MAVKEGKMNYWFSIRRECYMCGRHTPSLEEIVRLPYDKGLKYLEDKKILRKFTSPFNSSIIVVVIE